MIVITKPNGEVISWEETKNFLTMKASVDSRESETGLSTKWVNQPDEFNIMKGERLIANWKRVDA